MAQPVEVQRLIATLEARFSQYERSLDKAVGKSDRSFKRIETRGKTMQSRLQDHFRKAAQATSVIDGPLGGVAGRLSSVATLAGGTGLALGGLSLVMAGGALAASKALAEYQKFETQQLVLQQVLRATGGASGKSAKDIEALAQSIASATLASTGEVREAAAQLLTFRSVSGETFDRTLRLAQDLATVGFGTLKSSSVQLGKALEDPINGLSALRRVGVSFSDAQRQVIQDLVNTGRTAEAQEKILDALEQQVGGAGNASAQGLAGAYDSLSQATQNLLVRWGSQIATAINLKGSLSGIADAIHEVNAAAEGQMTALGRLAEVERKMEVARNRQSRLDEPAPLMISRRNAAIQRDIDTTMTDLLKERQRLQREVFDEGQKHSMVQMQGIRVQKEMERERAEGVASGLEQELQLARKTSAEKRIALELGKAGVTAESDLGQRIIANVQAIEAATEAMKKRGKAEKKDDLERTTDSLEEQIRAMAAQTQAQAEINPLIEDYGRHMAYATTRHQLLAAAQRAGADMTEKLAGKIDDLASRYADAVAAGAELTEQQAKGAETAKFFGDMIGDSIMSAVPKIETGNAALDRLLNTLLEVSTQALLLGKGPLAGLFGGGLFGGGGARGGIFGGAIIPGILHSGGIAGKDGYGHGRAVSPAVFAGAKRMHGGGIAGQRMGLRPDEVPAILQRGEAVIPKGAGGGGGGDVTYAPTYNIDASGAQEGVAEQIIAALEEYDRTQAPNTARRAVGAANRVSSSPDFRRR